MGDAIFEDARLAAIYDPFDSDRSDLDAYAAMVDEFGALSILDIGCGTGTFACRLGARGIAVYGVDPAAASLDLARKKPGAERVGWFHGTVESLPSMTVDMAVMTGNVAQVFLTDEEWQTAIARVRELLRPGGHLIFETRDPGAQAWLGWTRKNSYERIDVPNIGYVEGWVDLTDVQSNLVSFRWTYDFERDHVVVTSDSTLRFRGRDEIIDSLHTAGLIVDEVREAPDRPGLEFVFVARRPID